MEQDSSDQHLQRRAVMPQDLQQETLCEALKSLDCSGWTDIKADVVLLVQLYYGPVGDDRPLLGPFMEAVVRGFHVSPDSVRFSLVVYTDGPPRVFPFEESHNVSRLIHALRSLPFEEWPTVTTAGEVLTYVRRKVLTESGGARAHVPWVLILFTDLWPDDAEGPAQELRGAGVEVFVVGVEDAIKRRDLLEALVSPPAAAHVFTREEYKDLQQIVPELTESVCLRVQYKMKTIKHNLQVSKEDTGAGEL